MSKLRPLSIILLCFMLISCNIKQSNKKSNNECQIFSTVFDTFMIIHSNEFKYMDLDSFYICQFSPVEIDSALVMKELLTLKSFEDLVLRKNNLLDLGKSCLNISNIKYLDSIVALDTLMFTNSTNKVIWGITNFKKNSNYAYLVFGGYFSKKAVIVDQYLLELKNGEYEIINIVQ